MVRSWEEFEPEKVISGWSDLTQAQKIDIIEQFSRPTSDNSVYLDRGSGAIFHGDSKKKPLKLHPKFKPEYTSLVFNEPDSPESWESDPSAPKEMILSYANTHDKGDGATDYDISKNSKPWECPVELPASRRLLGVRQKITKQISDWAKVEKKYS